MKHFRPSLTRSTYRQSGSPPKLTSGTRLIPGVRAAFNLSRPPKLRLESPVRVCGPVTARTAKPAGRRRGPGKHWLRKPAVIVLSGGRERCNPGTPEGRAEYLWRKVQMWVRQVHPAIDYPVCCICLLRLALEEATFEHEFGRHASRIDERIWNPDTQQPQNGVSHGECNAYRGSRRTPIWHGNNFVMEKSA